MGRSSTASPVESEAPATDAVVRRACAGSRAAFRRLYELFSDRVARRAARLLGPGPDVDDVVQETFIQVHRSLHRFRVGEPFTPWLHRIAWNVAVSHLRRRRRPLDLTALRQFATSPDGWRRLAAREKVRILYGALDQVADEAREAFVLYTLEGMTLAEVADATDTSINTVAARVRRTRERLRALLERVDEAAKQGARQS